MAAAAISEQRNRRTAIPDPTRNIRYTIRDFAATIIRSVHPREDEAWLVEAELRLYRRSTRYSALVLAAGAFLVTQACVPWIPWTTRTVWWTSLSALCIAFYFFGLYLDRTEAPTLDSIRLRARCYLAMNAVFVPAWCSMSVFLWVPGEPLNHMLLVLFLACSLAGSIAIIAVHPATALTAFLVNAGFIVGPLALSRSSVDETLAWLSVVFVFLMAGQLLALTANVTKILRLEHERAGLVDGLLRAKAESDRERARAAAATRVKSQFLSNMNHDLRTPMNAILGFSELIKSKSYGAAVDKYAEYAEIIHESGRRLLALIDDVLDLAKIEGGRLSLRETELDLGRLLAEVFETYEFQAETAQIAFGRRIPRGGVPWLRADARGMRQMLANLVENALKFTLPGGRITLFAELASNGGACFGVEDTGIGIAEAEQTSVFERFGKMRADVTTADRGAGLGLAIVKGFAEAHDGEVRLESRLGSGTRITVHLPAERVCTGAPPQHAAA